MNNRLVLRIGAIGAAAVVVTFIGIAIVMLPLNWEVPGDKVLTGQLTPTSADFDQYLSITSICYVLDSVLIVGWIVSWVGIAILIQPRNKMVGNTTLVLGLIGAVLDLSENSLVWALLEGLQKGVPAPEGSWYYLTWMVIRQLSYLVTFAASAIAAMGLWSPKPLDRVMSGIGTLLALIALAGLFIPALSLLPNIWWMVWFGCGSLLLWRRAEELAQNDKPVD
jgi:hypothetical protein